MAKVVRESISILNITRLELAKNRGRINWLISQLQSLERIGVHYNGNPNSRTKGIGGVLRRYFQLLSITSKVQQTSQSLTFLLEHVEYVICGTLVTKYNNPNPVKGSVVGHTG